MTDRGDRAGLRDPDTLQGYACIAIAVVLGLTVLTIMILSTTHWITH
jgi:hypothetical protein